MSMAIELFVIGAAAASGPCLVSCSPVIIPYVAATRRGWREGLFAVSAFLLGRMAAYALLGAAAGLAGRQLMAWLHQYSGLVYLAAALFIALMGLLVMFKAGCRQGCRRGAEGGLLGSGVRGPILLGLTVGILPCLPLSGVLAYIALESDSVWHASLYGALFGAGKFVSPLLPLGVLAGALPGRVFSDARIMVWFSRICGAVLLAAGINMAIQRFAG